TSSPLLADQVCSTDSGHRAPGRDVAGAPDHSAARSVSPSRSASVTTRSTTSGSELWNTPSSSARAESGARSEEVAGSGSPGMDSATESYSGAGRRKREAEEPCEDMYRTVRAVPGRPHCAGSMSIPRQLGPETGPRTALPDYSRSSATVERMVAELHRGPERKRTAAPVRALFPAAATRDTVLRAV